MRLTTIIFCLSALLALTACGERGHPYPADVVENFLRACTARGAREAACRCSLDAIRRRWTADEYRAIEARIARGEVPPELADLTAHCRGR